MDSREVRDLMEAYLDVYASEEEIDEAEKPFPYEKVKAKQVALRDEGGNALDRRMKMGMAVRRAKEAEKTGGSQRDAGKGWYHAKEEFELWVDSLLDEGYDLSDYTWDEVYEAYTELLESERQRYKPDPTSTGYGTPEQMNRKPEDRRIPNKDTAEWLRKDAKTKKYGRPMRDFQPGVIKRRDIERQGIRTIPQVVRRNPDEFKPVPILQNNSYNYYDAVLAHLVNEGYADNFDSAIKIMVNMSEEWKDSIVEANRGDEYATRNMSPEDAKTWKSERRNRTRGFGSDVEAKSKMDQQYKRKFGRLPKPDPNYMGSGQRKRQSDTKHNRGKRTTLVHTTKDTLSPSGIKGTVTTPQIRIGTPLGGTKNPEPTGKHLRNQQLKDAQSSDPRKRSRAPQNDVYHMN